MLILRASAVWVVIILVEIVHGVLRGAFLVPFTGDLRARQLGVFIGSTFIFVVVYLFSPWLQAEGVAEQIGVGLFWVLLTLVFEITFGIYVLGASTSRIFEDYDILNGGLMPLGLIFMLLAPALAARLHSRISGTA